MESKKTMNPMIQFIMNPPTADAMAYEAKKDEAEYYKDAYLKEKEKNACLEKLLNDSSKKIELLNNEYQKKDKQYNDAVTKAAQILRAKRD